MASATDSLRFTTIMLREGHYEMTPEARKALADLLESIAEVYEQPPCDAEEPCNRCSEPDPVIIDAMRLSESL